MKFFFDTEFIDDGETIDLISIGIVAQTGAELYLCNADCDLRKAWPWVRENVFPHLPPLGPGSRTWFKRADIRHLVHNFIANNVEPGRYTDLWSANELDDPIEFWAYYADYDWVAFCQLYGTMMQLPTRMPKFCLDLQQWGHQLGPFAPAKPEQTNEHHALADARWNREYHARLVEAQQRFIDGIVR